MLLQHKPDELTPPSKNAYLDLSGNLLMYGQGIFPLLYMSFILITKPYKLNIT